MSNKIVLFISYSHDNEQHREKVAQLSERLRKDGFHTELDQYVIGSPEQGWPRWMLDKLDEATYVLVICTETYYRRFRGHEEPDKGKGVDWEGRLITSEMYIKRSNTVKFVPILFNQNEEDFIPEPLRSGTHYILDSEVNYQNLCDFLHSLAGLEPGPIGKAKEKQRAKVEPLSFESFSESNSKESLNTVSVQHEKHITFQNQIRSNIETELAKDILKPLRDGFIETIWVEAGKLGEPTIPELMNEWFVIDQTSHCTNPEIILEKLLRATEFCLEQLEAKGEKISSNHIIWKAAKQILGWLTTLAIRSEELANSENENVFDEIDVVTLIGVEIYTARKKEHPANFQADTTKDSKENYRGDKLLDLGFFPETGWQTEDAINQIWLIIWKAVGNKERKTPLTPNELKQLNKTLLLHQSRRKNSLNYHFAVRKSATHPLLIADICNTIKTELPELTIVHIGTESGKGSLLMISEGIIVALIEEFLNLIEQY